MTKLPLISALLLLASLFPVLSAETRTRYSHGDPTPDEQYMLELINRARANPAAEGEFLLNTGHSGVENAVRYFKLDLASVRKDFSSYPARPPLAFNPFLMRSARVHSADMAKRNFQSHDSSDGSSFVDRIAVTGYPYNGIAENVYSLQVSDTVFAHAGFNIDWGTGIGGIQTGVGHRQNIMGFSGILFREVGIGVIARVGSGLDSQGKLSITQDFGLSHGSATFLLGVVYSDKNANGICDPGEGIPDVTVSPSIGNNFAVTSTSGGYAIPFASAASGVLTFSGGGLETIESRTFSISQENLKIDLITRSGGKPLVALDVLDRVARETRGRARLRVRRSGATATPLTVAIRRSKGNNHGKAAFSDYHLRGRGLRGADGKSRNFRVTIPAGKSSAIIRLKAVNDRKKEPTEKVSFKIRPASNYQIEKSPAAKIFIIR